MEGKNSKIYKLTSAAPSLTKRRIELLHPVWNNIIIIISLLLQARWASFQFILLLLLVNNRGAFHVLRTPKFCITKIIF